MIDFKLIYFNQYGFKHSEELVSIPIHLLIGVSQDYIIKILIERRKYTSMDCVFICTKGHQDVEAFIPYLYKSDFEKPSNLFG